MKSEIAERFGYRIYDLFRDIKHGLGLLHTSRAFDEEYALEKVHQMLVKKHKSFALIVSYESKIKDIESLCFKIYIKGNQRIQDTIVKYLHKASVSVSDNCGAIMVTMKLSRQSKGRSVDNCLVALMRKEYGLIAHLCANSNAAIALIKSKKKGCSLKLIQE